MSKLYELRRQVLKDLGFKPASTEVQKMFENYRRDMQKDQEKWFEKYNIRIAKTAEYANLKCIC